MKKVFISVIAGLALAGGLVIPANAAQNDQMGIRWLCPEAPTDDYDYRYCIKL
ncbi:MAG: hypothetical protein ACRDAX_07535 [Propionibacteriaceae bacterium]